MRSRSVRGTLKLPYSATLTLPAFSNYNIMCLCSVSELQRKIGIHYYFTDTFLTLKASTDADLLSFLKFLTRSSSDFCKLRHSKRTRPVMSCSLRGTHRHTTTTRSCWLLSPHQFGVNAAKPSLLAGGGLFMQGSSAGVQCVCDQKLRLTLLNDVFKNEKETGRQQLCGI